MTQLPAAVCFSGKSLSIIDRDGVPHLSARDLAHALGYADERSVLRIYNRHSEEFTYQMSLVVNLTTVTGDNPPDSSALVAATWYQCLLALQLPPRFVAGCWMCWNSCPQSARRAATRLRTLLLSL